MKAWNHRHPNLMLAFWVIVWVVYATWAVNATHDGDLLWAVVFFIMVLWADARCKYWYNRPWEVVVEKEDEQ